MSIFDTHPTASHIQFPYYFTDDGAGTPTDGINFISFYLIYDGDLLIYYGNTDDSSSEYIDCWCSRWDVQNYNIIIETWLKKGDLQTLTTNITPGAVGELYRVLDRPKYYDATWSDSNTLKIKPSTCRSRDLGYGTKKGKPPGNLSKMRNPVTMFVNNISSSPVKGSSGWISVKIEGKIGGTGSL